MQKYGFREGQGLGKHEQGLSTALSVEKTSKRGGKIIVGDATEKGGPPLGQGSWGCGRGQAILNERIPHRDAFQLWVVETVLRPIFTNSSRQRDRTPVGGKEDERLWQQ